MDIFSMQFLYALGAIILIDLVLAGDNAIVIALAARSLPTHLQKKAIVWGTVGAIGVRTVMTVAVVWLLKIPGLLLIGGALLLWIAVRLLAQPSAQEGGGHAGVFTFWGAMKTIIVADALMGLDNVLAVAGAAQGSFLLVVLGLLISIPIVVWGSTLILKWVERFPVIVYVGAAVLALTSAKMMFSEPVVRDLVAPFDAYVWIAYAAIVGAVVAAGHAMRFRAAAGAARFAEPVALPGPASAYPAATAPLADPGSRTVEAVLLPVSTGPAARATVDHLIRHSQREGRVHVHLLHVAPRLHRHITRFLPAGARRRFVDERAIGAWAPALRALDLAGIQTTTHVVSARDIAQEILRSARRLGCERITMGASRKSALVRSLTHSVTGRVLAHATMPVEVISSRDAPLWQRVGVPASVCIALGALLLELD